MLQNAWARRLALTTTAVFLLSGPGSRNAAAAANEGIRAAARGLLNDWSAQRDAGTAGPRETDDRGGDTYESQPVDTVVKPVEVTDEVDLQILQRILEYADRMPEILSVEHCRETAARNVENYAWTLAPQLELTLTAWRFTGDTKYLDRFIAGFANMQAAMQSGPDGYLGWYGLPLPIFRDPSAPGRKTDLVIVSHDMAGLLARFIEETNRSTELQSAYAAQRQNYLDLMENHLLEKWTARGNYRELPGGGAVFTSESALRPDQANLTLPHNKNALIAKAYLAAWRATGDSQYREIARKLGLRFKQSLSLQDERYVWNYWDPAGDWDVSTHDSKRWKSWMGPEHKSSYYKISTHFGMMLYHHGMVFDDTDRERFLNTQMQRCWNGNPNAPRFSRVDGSPGEGEYISHDLAAYEDAVAQYLYSSHAQQKVLRSTNGSWSTATVAAPWLKHKLVLLPKAQQGLLHAVNPAQVEYEVTGSGYTPPLTPADAPW